MFDKKKFKFLIEKAMGARKISQYAEDSGVNRTYLSKYINQRLDNPPTPDILKRLSNASYDNISYEELMEASGYIDNKIAEDINTHEEHMINSEFGVRLKLLREKKGLTQQELAKILKISSSTIGMYEQNRRSPDIETLKSISDYFQCSTDYLLGKSNIEITENLSDEAIEIDNILGKRIKLLRTENGLTQEEFGKPYNLKKSTISQYESGFSKPDDELKKRIVSDFNVSLDWLMGLTNIRNPYNNTSSTPNPKSLGKIISEYREKNNLSLQDFADKSDLDCEYINNLEKEKVLKSPSLGDICKIAQLMSIPEMDLLEQIGYVKPNPESDKILKKCNELLEEYIKSHKDDDENKIRSKGLYTTLLIKKLFEDGLINDDGEIDDSYIELIKASLKTDSKLLNKDNK